MHYLGKNWKRFGIPLLVELEANGERDGEGNGKMPKFLCGDVEDRYIYSGILSI